MDPNQPVVPVFVGGDNPQCNIPEVQARVSTFILAMNLITGLLSAVVAPQLGRLSDRLGRTRLMGFASLGGLIGEIITVIIANFADYIDYRWLILGSIFDGATGSFTAGSILTQSYTSDSTPPSKRAVYIGYTHACLFIGLAFGPLLAGYFVKWTGSLLSVFYVIVACHATFIIIVAFIVPESLAKRKRLLAQEKWAKEKAMRTQSMGTWLSRIQNVNPFEPLAALWPQGPGTSTRIRLNLVCLAITDMIIFGSSIAVGAVLLLYSEYTFGWGTLESSQFISALSLVRVAGLLALLPLVNYIAKARAARRNQGQAISVKDRNSGASTLDVWIIQLALVSEIIGVVGYILARDAKVFFVSGMVTALGGLGGATVQAVVTKHVPQQKVGQVLGAIGMLHALARVVGPVIFNGIYAGTVGTFPQAFLVVLAGCFGLAFLASLVIKPHRESFFPRSMMVDANKMISALGSGRRGGDRATQRPAWVCVRPVRRYITRRYGGSADHHTLMCMGMQFQCHSLNTYIRSLDRYSR